MTDATPTETPLDAALDQNTFDVFEFVTGAATPEDTVEIYTNNKVAHRLAVLYAEDKTRTEADAANKKAGKKTDNLSIADETEQLDEALVNELIAELEQSKLVIEVKGLAPAALDALILHHRATTDYIEGGENERYNAAVNAEIFSRSIVSIANAAGVKAATLPNKDNIESWLKNLHADQRAKLENKIWEVSTLSGYFDLAVTADFS